MGSWNETCGISRLPIFYNDDVYLMIIGSDTAYYANEDYCCDDTCSMIGFPIKGQYDGAGGLKAIEIKDYVWDFLKNQKYIFSYNDENYEPSSIEDFISRIPEGVEMVCEPKNIVLSIYMIHKELYDRIMSNYTNRKCYNRNITYGHALKQLVLKKMGEIRENRQKISPILEQYPKLNQFYHLGKMLNISNSETYEHIPSIVSYLGDKMINEDNHEWIADIADYIAFLHMMNDSRNSFFGHCGRGSSSQEMAIHKIVAKFILDFIKERNKKTEAEKNETNEETLHLPYDLTH